MTPTQPTWMSRIAAVALLAVCMSGAPVRALVISEIMYHAPDETLEFVELYNDRAVLEDLSGFAFSEGIAFQFPAGTMLRSREYLVVARDPNALRAAYGITNVVGPFDGKLSNSGERVTLRNENGGMVLTLRYADARPWPVAADGTGHSLVLQGLRADPEVGTSWAASTWIGGSPGAADAPSETPALRINEIAAADAQDWIELYNAGPTPADLTGLYLSDDAADLLKFRLPEGVSLAPGGFWTSPGQPGGATLPFAVRASGETVFLTRASAEASPMPLAVLDALRCEALPAEATFGRSPDGAPRVGILEAPSANGANASLRIGEIVINEIMYHHGLGEDRYEYVELLNRGVVPVDLSGWAFTDGIDFTFPTGAVLPPQGLAVVAKDPDLLADLYTNLVPGQTLFGPYQGVLGDHRERIRLAYPVMMPDPNGGEGNTRWVTADEVTYVDGGQWPVWADGRGASLELRDPHAENDSPAAWAASDERSKSGWVPFSFTVEADDSSFTHDSVTVFDMFLLNQGEVLLDDIQVTIDGEPRLENGGFEEGTTSWRILGNHVQSHTSAEDAVSGASCLHLIATGHGDPGANRINQSIKSVPARTVTFSGQARWLRGSRFLLLRVTRERQPKQPPWPSHTFTLEMPLAQGTPGRPNTAWVANRGPDIADVRHEPVVPAGGEAITVTARITDVDGVAGAALAYRSEGQGGFAYAPLRDDGIAPDTVAGDQVFAGRIPPASAGTMRAFRVEASDGQSQTVFPTPLPDTADVPLRTCLIRVGDTVEKSPFARYRIWLSDDVIETFRHRTNLSNELLDCTIVYNESEVFYNARVRFRGSPFLRGGSGRDPRGRYAFRLEFNADQRFGSRTEINLDNTEGSNRGPLQERASFWFYRRMGLPYSRHEFVRPVINGTSHGRYEDVQKIDGDYVDAWFPDDNNGVLHKVDDYFEYDVEGTNKRNLDEGLKWDKNHPLYPETYRWGFEKRSHRDDDDWTHVYDFVTALNTPAKGADYEQAIESVMDPEYFARVLALRHAVGDWDSYGFNRGKNNYFYYAAEQGRWFLIPWDIDFTLGSGRGATENLFSVTGSKFPEVVRFLNTPRYRQMYLDAFSELISGPWRTSYGTENPPTAFDAFLDDAANALIADGQGAGRRDGIKQYVRDRRAYIATQVPAIEFSVGIGGADTTVTAQAVITLTGVTPREVAAVRVNGTTYPLTFTGKFSFEVEVPVAVGANILNITGVDASGRAVAGAQETLIVVRVQPVVVTSVTPAQLPGDQGPVALTIRGQHFTPGSATAVTLTQGQETQSFNALYVQHTKGFDRIDEASLILDEQMDSPAAVRGSHPYINFSIPAGQGEFPGNELDFLAPFDQGGRDYAIRLTADLVIPSPGIRYFGVNSDDGFSLRIYGQLVGEYGDGRAPATTDVTGNGTAGSMSFNFPVPGRYPLVLDFFENDGGEALEFFQTDASGGNRRLINVDAELTAVGGDVRRVAARDVLVVDAETITCTVGTGDLGPGPWNVVVTPPTGSLAEGVLRDAVDVQEP